MAPKSGDHPSEMQHGPEVDGMKAEKEQALGVRCPTCGAKPREKCELSTGLPRTEPHTARLLAVEKE